MSGWFEYLKNCQNYSVFFKSFSTNFFKSFGEGDRHHHWSPGITPGIEVYFPGRMSVS